MYTRDSFDRQRAAMKQVERSEGRLLAGVSVGLGVAQLAAITWLDRSIEHRSAVAIEGAFFLAYVALVAWLLRRYQHRLHEACPTSPQCGVRLQGISERVAVGQFSSARISRSAAMWPSIRSRSSAWGSFVR